MSDPDWHGKPYYSLDAYCKNTFHRKCYKIALNAHLTCPNRDGTLDTRGCIFCSAGGSGDFAVDLGREAGCIPSQIQEGLALVSGKLGRPPAPDAPCIIAYFQAYTNTYGPIPYLEQIFSQALLVPQVCGISIATRPDCLSPEVLKLLSSLRDRFPDKFIWVELGLQTIHEETASYIRRGYPLSVFETAMANLESLRIPVIVHVILGLPGETPSQMLQTIEYLNHMAPFGIKLQLLHVLKDTDLAVRFQKGEFRTLSRQEYLDLLISCLERLSPRIVVHRITGDGPRKTLIAPLWSRDKKDVLNSLHHLCRVRNTWQGRLYPS